MTSTKPYLIRAIYEWILDNEMTPHLVVDVRYPGVLAPTEFVEDDRLVLNISPAAVRGLVLGNERIAFNARFGGVARDVLFPSDAVLGIFTRENGQGMVFPELPYPSQGSGESDWTPVAGSGGDLADRSKGAEASRDSKPASRKGKGKNGGPTLKIVK